MRSTGHWRPLKLLALLGATGSASGELDEAVRPRAEIVLAAGWSEVVASLTSPAPPAAFVAAGELIDENARNTLRALHRRGLLVPSAVYLREPNWELVERVYPLYGFGVRLLFRRADLGDRLHDLLGGSAEDVANHIVRRLGIRDEAVVRLLRLLSRGGEGVRGSPSDLAARLALSRTRLYQLLRAAGLPAVEQCQYFFRLLPALSLISKGGNVEDAAYMAGFSDATALRKSLRSRLGTSLSDLRAGPAGSRIADLWLEHHGLKGSDADSTPAGPEGRPASC